MKFLKTLIAVLPILFFSLSIQANSLDDSTSTNVGISKGEESMGSAGRILISDLGKVYNGAQTTFYGSVAYRVIWPTLQRRYTGTGWQSLGNISSGTYSARNSYFGNNGQVYSLTPSGVLVENYAGGSNNLPPRPAVLTGSGVARWIK